MSSKKKKATSQWIQCSTCSAVVIDRDESLHENDCPPNKKIVSYPYITNEVLICAVNKNKVNIFEVDDTSSMVYLSHIALQLCSIPVGDNVMITCPSGESYVRKAWKDHDKQQLSASLHEKDVISQGTLPKDVFTIQLFRESIDYASEITVKGVDDYSEDVLVNLKHFNLNKIYRVGNIIALTHYGKRVTFRIVEIKSFSRNSQSSFFKVSNDTIWSVNKDGFQINNDVKIRIGGLDDVLNDIHMTINVALQSSLEDSLIVPRGIILYGPSGTGKSLTIKKLAEDWERKSVKVVYIQCNYDLTRLKKEFGKFIDKAKHGSSFIILLDDLDVICAKKSNTENEITSILATFFDLMSTFSLKIIIISTCNLINNIDPCLRRPGRFDKEIEINVPSAQQRLEILNVLIEDKRHFKPTELKLIADKSHGFVGADLVSLFFKATETATSLKCSFSGSLLLQCLPLIKPSTMREIMIQVPDVRWEDIGGQEDLKYQLRQAVEWPLKYPDSFARLGVSPPRGILMYGPPGCSKTMVAKALATESGLNFISVKGPELFSKWVGESEKAIREVFRRARQAAPSIVFFDELDALAGERSSSAAGNQVQERVLAQLLTELDGVEALGHVVVVGATNRPDRIDAALLRPGRLDRVVYVPLPDFNTRLAIFQIRLRRTPAEFLHFSLRELAELTEGYSGAEICAVCNEAALSALGEDLHAEYVLRSHFLSALKIVTARTPASALTLYEQYKSLNIR